MKGRDEVTGRHMGRWDVDTQQKGVIKAQKYPLVRETHSKDEAPCGQGLQSSLVGSHVDIPPWEVCSRVLQTTRSL